MASLTQVAVTTRKAIRYSIYALVGIIVLRFVFGIGKGVYKQIFPEPTAAPTIGFGVLPKLPFPETEKSQLQYKLETASGTLPNFPAQIYVYYMPAPIQTQLNYDNTVQKATRLGFTGQQKKLSETLYEFSHPAAPSTLEMNIITNVFSVNYDFTTNPNLLSLAPPTPDVAKSAARNFLSRAGLLPEDISGAVTHDYLRVQGRELIPVISLSEADFVKVNLFRDNYLSAQPDFEIPAVTPEFDEANVWFIVSGARNQEEQIIAAEYHYFPIDKEQFESYPIKTTQQAFDELSSGAGYIARIGSNTDMVTIREAYLAYYDSGEPMEFYQPIIVFEGDNNFVAYVPAVISNYYGE